MIKKVSNKQIIVVMFCVYIISLVLFVLLKFDGSFDKIAELHNTFSFGNCKRINLVPLQTIKIQYLNISERYFLTNILGNFLVFVPLGFFMRYLIRKNNIKIAFGCLIIILLFELLQYLFQIGFFDVDDILLNSSGSLAGIAISKITIIRKEGKQNEKETI